MPAMRTGRATRRTIILIMPIITTTGIAITRTITAIPMLTTTNRPVEPAAACADIDSVGTVEAAALYRLMTWLLPAVPVGAFAYSSGIEWPVEAGDIGDAAMLRDWLSSMLDGPGFCDGV